MSFPAYHHLPYQRPVWKFHGNIFTSLSDINHFSFLSFTHNILKMFLLTLESQTMERIVYEPNNEIMLNIVKSVT